MQTAVIKKTEVQNDVMQGYSLKVNNLQKLKDLFKDRFNRYVDSNGIPTTALVNLLCNGDDILQTKIRALVDILPVAQ